MSHRTTMSRSVRRLVSVAALWSCLCYVAFRFSQSNGPESFLDGKNFQRALLQNQPISEEPPVAGGGITPSTKPTTSTTRSVINMLPHIDTGDNDIFIKDMLANITNIPVAYYPGGKFPPIHSKSCVKYPPLYDLDFNNVYWQKFPSSNGTFHIYGAYYDDRPKTNGVPLVRLILMVDRLQPPPTLCQLWYDDGKFPVITAARYTYAWYAKWGNYKDGFLQPFIVSCKIPSLKNQSKIPSSVSLVEKQCQHPTTNVRVINNRPVKKENFAVCVKGLDFLKEDLSVRLVEWLELLRLLGAHKVFMYELEIHPNISKVLKYYQDQDYVTLTPITLPGSQPNLPGLRHHYLKLRLNSKRQNELVPYNDCLYRNLYSYKYLVLLDIDEVIMPSGNRTWKELMDEVIPLALKLKNYTRASYNVRNVYFFDDFLSGDAMKHEVHEEGIPSYMHMLQHVYRSQNFTKPGSYVKCFHEVDRVVSLHNHFPLNCFGTCTTYPIPTDLAQLQHYRKDCVGSLKKVCDTDYKKNSIRDTKIWRFKDPLIERTTDVLKKLGYFS